MGHSVGKPTPGEAVGFLGTKLLAFARTNTGRTAALMLTKALQASYGDLTNVAAGSDLVSELEIAQMQSYDYMDAVETATEFEIPAVAGPEVPWSP